MPSVSKILCLTRKGKNSNGKKYCRGSKECRGHGGVSKCLHCQDVVFFFHDIHDPGSSRQIRRALYGIYRIGFEFPPYKYIVKCKHENRQRQSNQVQYVWRQDVQDDFLLMSAKPFKPLQESSCPERGFPSKAAPTENMLWQVQFCCNLCVLTFRKISCPRMPLLSGVFFVTNRFQPPKRKAESGGRQGFFGPPVVAGWGASVAFTKKAMLFCE
jgi:hypothetical protein